MGETIQLFARNIAQSNSYTATTQVAGEGLHDAVKVFADKVKDETGDGPILVSLEAFEPTPVSSVVSELPPPPVPTLPKPTGPNWVPPERSEVIEVARNENIADSLCWNIIFEPAGVFGTIRRMETEARQRPCVQG